MASNGNFATLNRLNTRGSSASSQITGGNLQYNGQATQDEVGCTINVGNDGVPKVYFEVYIINNHDTGWLGIYDTKVLTLKYEKAYGTTSYRAMKFNTGQKVTGSTSSNYIGDGSANNSRSGQTVGVAIDVPNGKIWFAINNAWGSDGGGSPTDSNVAFTDLTTTGSYDIVTHMGGASVAQPDWLFNFGADSTMQGRVTAGGNADDNGFGDFRYSPPTGFVALCSANINISDDIDPAQTDDDFPQKQFNVVTYSGNGSTQSITGLGFKPDFVWIKERSSGTTANHKLMDSNRGVYKAIESNGTGPEGNDTNGLTAYGTDGFSLGTDANYNQSSETYVAWCWRANGGTTASNTDGSITSTVQANDKAGFSIITWTASGSNGSIGHGLSAKPDWHIIKKLNGTSGWAVYHKSLGATKYYRLDTNSAASTFQYTYNNTEPDATKIYLGDNGLTNHPSGDSYICYAWRAVEGYSAFGTYNANGNSDGPFIYTGFRPRMLFIRRYSGTDSSFVIDTARETKNVNGDFLFWDSTQAETSSSLLDILSNGFKLRTTSASLNPSGTELIWGAWGDVPFKYNNTF